MNQAVHFSSLPPTSRPKCWYREPKSWTGLIDTLCLACSVLFSELYQCLKMHQHWKRAFKNLDHCVLLKNGKIWSLLLCGNDWLSDTFQVPTVSLPPFVHLFCSVVIPSLSLHLSLILLPSRGNISLYPWLYQSKKTKSSLKGQPYTHTHIHTHVYIYIHTHVTSLMTGSIWDWFSLPAEWRLPLFLPSTTRSPVTFPNTHRDPPGAGVICKKILLPIPTGSYLLV